MDHLYINDVYNYNILKNMVTNLIENENGNKKKLEKNIQTVLNIDQLKLDTIEMFNEWLKTLKFGHLKNYSEILENIHWIEALSYDGVEWVDLPILDVYNYDLLKKIVDMVVNLVETEEAGNKQDFIQPGNINQYWRGDKTWQNLDTSTVVENLNLYYTNERVKTYADTLYSPITHNHNISDITGLSDTLNDKFNTPSGTTSQYIRGDGSLASFPTVVSSWDDITNKPSWIGANKPTYSYNEITNTPNLALATSSANQAAENATGAATLAGQAAEAADEAKENANDAAEAANTAAGLANNAATTANTAAGLADTARLAIQDDLALKADQDDLVQLAGDVDAKVDKSELFEIGKNLYNPNDSEAKIGFYVSPSNGNLVTAASQFVTGFIPVIEENSYTFSDIRFYAWFNSERVFISGSEVIGNGITVTAPTGAKYLRASTHNDYRSFFQVEKGSEKTTYEPYNRSIKSNYLDNYLLKSDSIELINKEINIDSEAKPKLKQSSNLFNKDNVVSGLVSSGVVGTNISITPNVNWVTSKIVVRGIEKITFTRVGLVVFVDSDNKSTLSTVQVGVYDTHTMKVPINTLHAYISTPPNLINAAQINIGDTLLPYEPYNFDLEYNGKKLVEDLSDAVKNVKFEIVTYSDFELGTVAYNSYITSSNERAISRVPIDIGISYILELESNIVEKFNTYYENLDGSLTLTSDSIFTGTETRKNVIYLVRKSNDANIAQSEVQAISLKVSSTVTSGYFGDYIQQEVNETKEHLEITSNSRIYYDSQLEIENEVLKDELAIQIKNINSLNKVKKEGLSDSQVIPLNRSIGGRFILGLHKRANDGYTVTNDAFLPNANNDFSDVRFISDEGEYLPYKVIYNGNIDILPDDRIASGSLVFVDSSGVLYGRKGDIVVKSSDGGYTWSSIAIDTTGFTILGIANDDAMYLGSAGKLYKSDAPYSSKRVVFDQTILYPDSSTLTSNFAQHPDGELFFGAYQDAFDARVFKSTDNGETWVMCYQNTNYQHVHNIHIDIHQSPIAVYVGLDGGGGIIKSVDKGVTWVDLRELNPTIPQSTDYGVIYSDENGFRLLSGETSAVGGYSIIKTEDDVIFKPVLGNGTGVSYVRKLNNKIFAGGVSGTPHRTTQIYLSEDDAETWKTIYTSGWIEAPGINTGYRYMSKVKIEDSSDYQILVGMAGGNRSPLRIFEGGNNYYAQVIVDIPNGCESITVESGYLITNEKNIYNNSISSREKIVNIPLNENKPVVMVENNGVKSLIKKDFDFVEWGKKLGAIYPPIVSPDKKFAAVIPQDGGFIINADLSVGDFSVGFWIVTDAVIEQYLDIIEKDGMYLRLSGSHQIWLGNSSTIIGHIFPRISGTFIRVDMNFKADGNFQLFVNGTLMSEKIQNLLPQRASWVGDISILNPPKSTKNKSYVIQGFEILRGLTSSSEALNNYYNGLFDNRE